SKPAPGALLETTRSERDRPRATEVDPARTGTKEEALKQRPAVKRETRASPDLPSTKPRAWTADGVLEKNGDANSTPADRMDPAVADGEPTERRESGVPYARLTAYAGLFFLVPLLSRLGIDRVLEANASLIDWRLGERILLQVAHRLGIERDDPILLALPIRS